MKRFDLGIAFVWEYDEDFVALIEEAFHNAGFSTFLIQYHNIQEVTQQIRNKEISFGFYLDRAWDVEEQFEDLGKILNRRKTFIFNPYSKVTHAIDKASMHLEFISAGLNVPHSIIIPPHSEKEEIFLSIDDLAILGRPFIIKPCNTTGGGIGVVTGAETLKEIIDERMTNSDDKYILQEKIYPSFFNGKRAWFRSFWAFGKAIPVWWDDQTHLYSELSRQEIVDFKLKKLFTITKKIAETTKLDFFSTEIVKTNGNKFVVIDYVNDQCDMRLSSKHPDGIPDNIVAHIINNMVKKVIEIKRGKDKPV
jgi:glutathione synthase/RimK-type ligase-like ATP-grasp enzyme